MRSDFTCLILLNWSRSVEGAQEGLSFSYQRSSISAIEIRCRGDVEGRTVISAARR
jgi:hypothetical protein